MTTPAGWYPDPENPGASRWWDGTAWGPPGAAPPPPAPPPTQPAHPTPAVAPPTAPSAVPTPPADAAPDRAAAAAAGASPGAVVPNPKKRWPLLWVLGGVVAIVVLLTVVGVLVGDDEEPVAEPPAGAYTTGDGCFRFVPAEGWVATVEHPKGVSGFATDPDNPVTDDPEPGTPGAYVEVGCFVSEDGAPLDAEPPELEGVAYPEWEQVDFGGGEGWLKVARFAGPEGGVDSTMVEYAVDHNGVRCIMQVSGELPEVEAIRDTVDEVAGTVECLGRK